MNDDQVGYAELRIWAEMLDDAMKARIAATNRAERAAAARATQEIRHKGH